LVLLKQFYFEIVMYLQEVSKKCARKRLKKLNITSENFETRSSMSLESQKKRRNWFM